MKQHIMKSVRTRYNAATYTITATDGDGHRIRYKVGDLSKEEEHHNAALTLIERKWTNSPEVLDVTKHQLKGGWMGPGEYVWVVDNAKAEGLAAGCYSALTMAKNLHHATGDAIPSAIVQVLERSLLEFHA